VAATEPARPAGECLQAGVFDEEQANALRRVAGALPQGSWSLQRTTIPGRWMVYMGKFADADALAKKRAELRELGISFDRPSSASLEPGLSLGRFSTEEAAQRGLGNLVAKGVRTAKVVQERPDTPGYQLRLPSVDDALRPPAGRAAPGHGGQDAQALFPDHSFWSSRAGKRTVNRAPGGVWPGRASSTLISAWCWRAISCTMGRPSPEPSASLPSAR
jgi:hypothetical protein